MKNVLIATMPDDSHAVYVKLGLEKKGHKATLWYTADLPEFQKHTFEIKNKEICWYSRGVDFSVDNNHEFDVVWLRRPRKPIMPSYLHHDDVNNAVNENREFFKTIWQVIAPSAKWINPINHARSTNTKLHQLKIAAEVGFDIPDSLFSNDPLKIKDFINSYGKGCVVYKQLCPVYWVGEDYMRVAYTREISEEMLPSDPILQSTPGIYQSKIEKDYELRVTYFGDVSIAVKLDSQMHEEGRMDWRLIPAHKLTIERYDLPGEIDKKCKEFMKKLGVNFGCFDFIVTKDKKYYFLEINEQGQFLWIEELNPEIKMLEPFVNYIIESSGGVLDPLHQSLSLKDFSSQIEAAVGEAKRTHKDPGLNIH
jgi:glutathione synthase/RimK-type ligase-like ATP-grasp enzyme